MNDDWGFTQEDTKRVIIKQKHLDASYKRYHAPISRHDCTARGCGTHYGKHSNLHEIEEVWDDFELSQRQREEMFMEMVRSRDRVNREMTLIRMFVSTLDGSYVIRLSTANALQSTRMGQIRFDDKDECTEYYNYCINLFGFSSSLIVRDEDEDGFFDDLDELSGGFFDDLGDIEDEDGWDMDDEDDFDWN